MSRKELTANFSLSIMKKVDFNSLTQLLGMIGIIGSLLFVGLEMRQSQRIALAGQ